MIYDIVPNCWRARVPRATSLAVISSQIMLDIYIFFKKKKKKSDCIQLQWSSEAELLLNAVNSYSNDYIWVMSHLSEC